MRLRTLLVPALLLSTLFLGTAAAQPGRVLHPPSGPVEQVDGPRMGGDRMMRERRRGPAAQQQRHRLPPRVRAMLVARFDRNGDGRLTGRERAKAKRFVKQQRQGRQGQHHPRR